MAKALPLIKLIICQHRLRSSKYQFKVWPPHPDPGVVLFCWVQVNIDKTLFFYCLKCPAKVKQAIN